MISVPLLLFQMSPMGPYGNGFQFPQQFPPYQMPMWPQPPPNMWLPPKPAGFRRQSNTDQAQETQKPNEPQTKTPPEQQPVNQPPTPTPAKEETQPTQVRLVQRNSRSELSIASKRSGESCPSSPTP